MVRLGRSVGHNTHTKSPRRISVSEAPSLKTNAPKPIWMDSSEGKSVQSFTALTITVEHNAGTVTERGFAESERFQTRHI